MPINKKESTFILDIDFKGLRGEKRAQAQEEIGDVLLDKIFSKLDSGLTPVKDGAYKRKKADGTTSRLELTGAMREALEVMPHRSGVKIGIFKGNEEQALKSFNHNTGDTLPARQFIPTPNGEFKGDIMKSIDAIINRIKRGES